MITVLELEHLRVMAERDRLRALNEELLAELERAISWIEARAKVEHGAAATSGNVARIQSARAVIRKATS